MKRLLVTGYAAAIAVLASWFAASYAAASHPDILRDYRFIPSRSSLDVSGGFIGIQETFHVVGTFGLVTGYDEGVVCLPTGCLPTPVPFAEFVDVRARLVSDSGYLWDLDDTLNLTRLDGTFHDPDHLFFTGTDNQGQQFNLEATMRDRLIHLVGASEPGCCDLYQYNLNALAYLRPNADFNLDGVVDAADYLVWRSSLGQPGATSAADGNGAVDAADYDFWRAHFGETFNFSIFDSPELSSSATPEPASVTLPFAAATLCFLRRRRYVQ
jgi:uncharacterized protein (TIGR03382 family)